MKVSNNVVTSSQTWPLMGFLNMFHGAIFFLFFKLGSNEVKYNLNSGAASTLLRYFFPNISIHKTKMLLQQALNL